MRWSRVRCCNYAYLKGERFYVEILKNAKDFKNVRLLARKYTFLKLQMFQKLLFERNRSKGRRMKHHWTRNLITAEVVFCAFCTVKDASGSSVASLWSSNIKVIQNLLVDQKNREIHFGRKQIRSPLKQHDQSDQSQPYQRSECCS